MRPLRRLLAGLLSLAGVGALLSAHAGWWAQRAVLDSDAFASTTGDAVSEPAVRDFFADEITGRVVAELPAEASSFRSRIRAEIASLVATEAFVTVVEDTVRDVHRALVDDEVDVLVLDLSGAVPLVRSAVERVDPRVAEAVPAGVLESVPVGGEGDLPDLSRIDETTGSLTPVAAAVAVFGIGAAFLLAPERFRLARRVGILTALGAGALFALVLLAPSAAAGGIDDEATRDAVEVTARVFVRSLQWETGAIAAVGLVVTGLGALGARRPRTARLR